ncbi:MAG: ferrous iron transport protein A [Clostridiales bacterium]|nr:ferrous iron transport protein A [Clostridiales bacterium]
MRNYTLDMIKCGKTAVVKSLSSKGAIRRRLLDLGITPKTEVMVRKVAPLGDPIEIYLRGYELAIRLEDAKTIVVDCVC